MSRVKRRLSAASGIVAVLFVVVALHCVPLGPILRLENRSGRALDSVVVSVRGDTTRIESVGAGEVIEYRLRPKGETDLRVIRYAGSAPADTFDANVYLEAGMYGTLTVRVMPEGQPAFSDSVRGWWPLGCLPALDGRRVRRSDPPPGSVGH